MLDRQLLNKEKLAFAAAAFLLVWGAARLVANLPEHSLPGRPTAGDIVLATPDLTLDAALVWRRPEIPEDPVDPIGNGTNTPKVEVATATLVTIGETSMTLQTYVECQISRKELQFIKVEVPNDVELNSVGDGLASFTPPTTVGDSIVYNMLLKTPQKDRCRLSFKMTARTRGYDRDIIIPAFRVHDVVRQNGIIGLTSAVKDAEVVHRTSQRLRTLQPQNLNQPQLRRATLAYGYATPDYMLMVRLQKKKSDLPPPILTRPPVIGPAFTLPFDFVGIFTDIAGNRHALFKRKAGGELIKKFEGDIIENLTIKQITLTTIIFEAENGMEYTLTDLFGGMLQGGRAAP